MSESTIVRRRRELGLRGSHLTTKVISDTEKRRLVLNQMAKDPSGKLGPRMVKMGIFQDAGIDLTRDWIANEMRMLAPEAYASRGPAHNKGRVLPSSQTLSIGAAHVPPPTISTTLTSTLESARSTAPLPTPAPLSSEVSPTRNRTRAYTSPALCPASPPIPTSMDVDSYSDLAADNSPDHDKDNNDDNNMVYQTTNPRPRSHSHPAQLELSELAHALGLPNPPRPSFSDDQTFSLVFDVLERATPTLSTLKHFLTGVTPANAREYEVVVKFREQLRVLDRHLEQMTTK